MDLLPIGYFSKTHGVKGHLILKDEASFSTEGLNALFIESATGKAPYFISEMRDTNTGLIVKLEDVDVVEKAKTLLGKKVFIDSNFVEEEEESSDWLGFELIDSKLGSLGAIKAVSSNGSQDLISVDYKGKEVILPLVDEFIIKMDEDTKKIWLRVPDGLIDLYLNDDEEK
ncbi:MAG: hypothetical protein PSX36_09250 [bacterium]|nr:hypothetical protein [bacterium]